MTNEKYYYQRFGDFTQGLEFKFLTRKVLSILDHYIWHVGEKTKINTDVKSSLVTIINC